MKPLQCRMYIGEKSHLLIGKKEVRAGVLRPHIYRALRLILNHLCMFFQALRCERENKRKKRHKKLDRIETYAAALQDII